MPLALILFYFKLTHYRKTRKIFTEFLFESYLFVVNLLFILQTKIALCQKFPEIETKIVVFTNFSLDEKLIYKFYAKLLIFFV